MRKLGSIIVLVIALVITSGIGAAGQFRERMGAFGHPLVGTWIVDIDTATTEDPPGLLTINSDGTLRLTSCCQAPGAGAWRPTTRRTADATVLLPFFDDEGFIGFSIARADVVLSIDGLTFTATYTQEIPDREGGTSGQLGPGTASGSRLIVEPLGEPVAPLPAAMPEASPAASPTLEPEGVDAVESPAA
jgi:hypothetical protein